MFSTFLQTISGYFNKRFLLSAFFPSLALGGLSLLVYVGLERPKAAVEAWYSQPAEWRLFLVIAFFTALLFIAYLLEAFSLSLARLYEGYWRDIPFLTRWWKHRRSFYQLRWDHLATQRFQQLTEQIRVLERGESPDETNAQRNARLSRITELYDELGEREHEWFRFFPTARGLVMPTKLGNILRAAELHPWYRYNLDSVVTWPRLQSLLPEAFATELRDAKATLDLLLNLTTLAVLYTLSWELYLGLATRRWDWFVIVSLGWVAAGLAYQAALHAARTYAEVIKAAYDLHRWELLSALHLQKPTSYDEERDLWGDVTDLLYRNYPPKNRPFVTRRPRKKSQLRPQPSMASSPGC